MTKIVALDIETAPAVAYSFTGFKANIGLDQIIEDPRMIAVSYQWQGQKRVGFLSEYHHGRRAMLEGIREVLDEADIIITYNGKSFDAPWITGELLVEGIEQPSPYQHIDLYQIMRGKIRFFSRKLDYAALRLLNDRKVTHTGFRLWRDCLMGSPAEQRAAWKLMKEYAIKDTALLFPLYDRLKPVIVTGHPNRALLDGSDAACRICGGYNYQKRGFHYSGISKFQRYKCMEPTCGAWFHSGHRLATTEMR